MILQAYMGMTVNVTLISVATVRLMQKAEVKQMHKRGLEADI